MIDNNFDLSCNKKSDNSADCKSVRGRDLVVFLRPFKEGPLHFLSTQISPATIEPMNRFKKLRRNRKEINSF